MGGGGEQERERERERERVKKGGGHKHLVWFGEKYYLFTSQLFILDLKYLDLSDFFYLSIFLESDYIGTKFYY